MHHVHAGLAAGGPPGRLQVQVRVHHVPCDTTELCTRRFGVETSKPDVGRPRLKQQLGLSSGGLLGSADPLPGTSPGPPPGAQAQAGLPGSPPGTPQGTSRGGLQTAPQNLPRGGSQSRREPR